MGIVFGKTGADEPAYDVVYQHTTDFSYEIRKYGTRYAAKTTYNGADDDTPFRVLARYIGVFGTPENSGEESISMTAPVIKETTGKPTPIAMTAPVVIQKCDDCEKTMEFILPDKYDSMDKVPKPTNPAVTIVELPPAVGVVHRYSGSMEDDYAKEMAAKLAEQLQKDGVDVTTEYMMQHFQFWGYNPPFTLPMLRRNEVWLSLDEHQIEKLMGQSVVPKN